jgi:hypothetical protein
MGCLVPVFTIPELDSLDEKQLEILRDAVLNEIRTSPEIRRIVREKTLPVFNRLKQPAGAARAARTVRGKRRRRRK